MSGPADMLQPELHIKY